MTCQPCQRGGFSFLELVASLAAASALVIGMASTLGVALRAADPASTPAANTLAGLKLLSELSSELTYALAITEKTAIAVTATIADRGDADTSSDSVRYSWSGTPGNPLVRQYNSGSPATVVANVHNFSIAYYPATGQAELATVRIQVSANSRTAVETTLPLLNRP
jgi:hypothetical protein